MGHFEFDTLICTPTISNLKSKIGDWKEGGAYGAKKDLGRG